MHSPTIDELNMVRRPPLVRVTTRRVPPTRPLGRIAIQHAVPKATITEAKALRDKHTAILEWLGKCASRHERPGIPPSRTPKHQWPVRTQAERLALSKSRAGAGSSGNRNCCTVVDAPPPPHPQAPIVGNRLAKRARMSLEKKRAREAAEKEEGEKAAREEIAAAKVLKATEPDELVAVAEEGMPAGSSTDHTPLSSPIVPVAVEIKRRRIFAKRPDTHKHYTLMAENVAFLQRNGEQESQQENILRKTSSTSVAHARTAIPPEVPPVSMQPD